MNFLLFKYYSVKVIEINTVKSIFNFSTFMRSTHASKIHHFLDFCINFIRLLVLLVLLRRHIMIRFIFKESDIALEGTHSLFIYNVWTNSIDFNLFTFFLFYSSFECLHLRFFTMLKIFLFFTKKIIESYLFTLTFLHFYVSFSQVILGHINDLRFLLSKLFLFFFISSLINDSMLRKPV